jgi:hypothetical protein
MKRTTNLLTNFDDSFGDKQLYVPAPYMTTFVGPCKFVAVSLLAYTLARIDLQPFFLPPNLQNIKFKLRHTSKAKI